MYSETNWHRSHLHEWENEPRLVIACKSSPCCSAPTAMKINNYTLQNKSYFAPPFVRVLYFISLVLKLKAQLISVQTEPLLLLPASVQSHVSVWMHALKSCLKAINIFFPTIEHTVSPEKCLISKFLSVVLLKPILNIYLLNLFSFSCSPSHSWPHFFFFLYFKILTK